MKKFFNDFKKFATKGNVMDMAVGVVIGAAFGKITTSLVNDIIMPLISLLTGGKSVVDWKWVIKPAVVDNGAVVVAETALRYGMFLQTMLDFLIIAFSIFLVLRLIMKAKEGFSAMSKNISLYSNKEKRALLKQGYTMEQVVKMENEKHAEVEAKAKAEADKKLQDEKANSSEAILKEIRDLLKAQALRETEQVAAKEK